MASTLAALKRTSEGQTLEPIGSEQRRQSSPPPHRLTNGGEVGWPDSQFSPFSGDGPFYSFDGAKLLESISVAASRGKRKPSAGGTWSRLPGILGRPTQSKARLARSRIAVEGDSPSRDPQPTESGDRPFATPAPNKRSCRATKGPCLFCKDHSASESAGEDEPALDGSGGRGSRPLFVHLQPPKAFGSKTSGPCRFWELEDSGWPVKPVPVLLPWESNLPRPLGRPGPWGPQARGG